VATAIERAERERYQRELYEITSSPDRSFEEKLDALFELGCERFDLDHGGIARIDPQSDRFEVERIRGEHDHLLPGEQYPLSETYCRLASEDGETAGVTDPVGAGFEGKLCYDLFGVQAYLGTHLAVDGDDDRTFWFLSNEPRDAPITDEERTFVDLMGQWVKSGLERRQREGQFAALNGMSRELMNGGTQAEIADVTVEHAQGSLQLPVTAMVHYDKRRGTLSPMAQTPHAEDELPTTMLCAPESGPLWETFVADETRFLDDVAAIDGVGDDLGEVVAVPLGREGLFVTATRTADGFSSAGLDFVQATAATVKAAFARADREQQLSERETTLEEQNRTLERLNRVNDIIRSIDQALVQASTRTEIETVVCEQLADAGPYELAWIGEHDVVTDEITPRQWAGAERGYFDEITVTADDSPEGQGPGGRAVRTREAQVANDVLDDPNFKPYRQAALNRGYHAHVALPLIYEDTLYGVLNVYAGQPGVFDELEQSVLTEMADNIAYAINAVESKKALVSDAVTELEFDVRDTEMPIVELSDELDCTISLDSMVPQADGRLRIFFSARGASPETFLESASRLPVENLSMISEHEEAGDPVGLFDGLLTDGSFGTTVLQHGGVPRETTVGCGNAKIVVELAGNAATREFVEMVQNRYPGTELVAQRTRERSQRSSADVQASLTNSLTDRQAEVLQTAYFSGYFEKPRTRTGSEIASSLDITQPTFNHHVRASQRKLFRSLFEDDDSLDVTNHPSDR
jgi:GAF domain-containing protein/DNA-binding CsgD family transcriptional regulator